MNVKIEAVILIVVPIACAIMVSVWMGPLPFVGDGGSTRKEVAYCIGILSRIAYENGSTSATLRVGDAYFTYSLADAMQLSIGQVYNVTFEHDYGVTVFNAENTRVLSIQEVES